ncbi:MAG: 4Fe-4S binding protein [Deltaproteobacteria bacterium]|jgi:Ni,Fe-hydrogenase III small subunit/Pyruvate/2-oxoacid:ferredoxin oxidoreductase delta subunit|nr:4Fe-4S binding protein [Deltaproteobacteria bacterium]
MLHGLIERLRQKKRTAAYPGKPPVLPERFRGLPLIAEAACQTGSCGKACASACPTGAIQTHDNGLSLDLGLCIFCAACASACPHAAISFSREYRLAGTSREHLVIRAGRCGQAEDNPGDIPLLVPLDRKLRSMFSRSLKLREISAAGCNACEADCNALGNILFDVQRFGIDFVASPRHADALLITGPLPKNMRLAVQKCHAAAPNPKIIIAAGTCAISGGLFRNLSGQGKGVPELFKPDLYIPGCPPHPFTILDGLLRLLGRI